MKILKKIWDFLDGHKTIICSIGYVLVNKEILPQSDIVEIIILILGGGSLGLHIKKGLIKKK